MLQAICLDCGDTLVDEGAEVVGDDGIAISADLIPGADELVRQIKQRGYPLALVADGPVGTFRNLLRQHGLYDFFDAFAISEQLGVEKPDARMFHHALQQLGVAPEQYGCTVMLGNNLARDIRGANALGIISVWIDWAPRRAKIPADALEVPRFTIKQPLELLTILDHLDQTLATRV